MIFLLTILTGGFMGIYKIGMEKQMRSIKEIDGAIYEIYTGRSNDKKVDELITRIYSK